MICLVSLVAIDLRKNVFHSFYCQILDLIKYNGPVRSTDCAALGCDLKIIRMILKSDSKNAIIRHNNSSSSSSSSSGAHENQETDQEEVNVEEEIVLSKLSSKCIVEQLPNTLSVSFKGLIDFFVVIFLCVCLAK